MMRSSFLQSAEFEAVSAVGQLQTPWEADLDLASQVYRMRAAGQNIWGRHDDFLFAWTRRAGNWIACLQGSFPREGVNPHRKFGWMARVGLEADAANVSAAVHGDGLAILQFRAERGGETREVRSPIQAPDVVQLERRGSRWIASFAHWGEPLQAVEIEGIDLGEALHWGVFLCSHEEAVQEEARIWNVRLSKPASASFNRDRDPYMSRMEIMAVENGRRVQLFQREEVFEAPNWTRDGQALIYNSQGLLHRYDLRSGEDARIPSGEVRHNNNDHVLSFDGKRLGISSHLSGHGSMIYTLPLEGGEPHLVTARGPSYLHGWSADGKYLVFTGFREGDFDIYRIPAEGGAEERLTNHPGLDDGPEYSPDGAHIWFNSVRSGLMQLWRMNADGSCPVQMTDDEYNNWFPHVSPDGSQVIFLSYLPGEVEPSDHPAAKRVYLRSMPASGGAIRVLAYLYGGQGTMNVPSWSADGRFIAFVSNSAG